MAVELDTGLRVGVRVNSADVAERLANTIGHPLVNEERIRPNLSLRIEEGTSPGSPRRLHTLYRGSALAVRTRQPGRAVAALLAHLDAFEATARDGPPRLATLAFERDGVLVLSPRSLRPTIDQLEPRLRRSGIAVVDQPFLELDPDGRTAVVPATNGNPGVDDVADLGPSCGPQCPVATRWGQGHRESRESPQPPGVAAVDVGGDAESSTNRRAGGVARRHRHPVVAAFEEAAQIGSQSSTSPARPVAT